MEIINVCLGLGRRRGRPGLWHLSSDRTRMVASFVTGVRTGRTQRRGFCDSKSTVKLWGGRFTGRVDPLMEKFNASISFDRTMWREDIRGSMAYALALARDGIITNNEAESIVAGLEKIQTEWRKDCFELKSQDEDIHTANERRLTEIIGSEIAGKLHTGRSRNDQVATDLRLWVKERIVDIRGELIDLLRTTISRAQAEVDLILPGYTHLQPAQPIRWSHWLLAYANQWKRDAERLDDLWKRVDIMPLGSGALAGHPFFNESSRKILADKLGFAGGPSWNSLDATSDRDFVVEFLFWAALTSTHLSRWSEDLIIYSSNEFKFVELSDAYSTGSSLMPQKKNPDASELLRGKTGRSFGNLISVLTTLKGLPMTYNKDLQEDKEPLFDSVNSLLGCLPIANGVMATLKPLPDNMRRSLSPDMLATDLADYLVRKGVPFRETHHIAGRAVKLAIDLKKPLSSLTLGELKGLHEKFDADVEGVWSFESSVESRDAQGSTSRRAVLEQVSMLEDWLNSYEKIEAFRRETPSKMQ